MITYNVTVDDTPIQFGATGLESVKQNLRIIATTLMSTVPFAREFGISADLIDLPTTAVAALLEVNIIAAAEQSEPRARITDVQIIKGESKLIPIISFTLNEEV